MKSAPKFTASQVITNAQSPLCVTPLLVCGLLTGSLLLVGCQSTALQSSTTIAANNTPIVAKTVLADALQKQRRKSFSYHSNLEINNDAQFMLSDAETAQLASSDYVDDYCEETHDQGYAALLAQSETQNSDIMAPEFDSARDTLKQNYLACNQAYKAWDDNRYDRNYDESAYYEEDFLGKASDNVSVAQVSSDERSAEAIGPVGTTINETSRIKSKAVASISTASTTSNNAAVSPYYQQLFDDYDSKVSSTDVKKSQLLDAYLLKPLSINAQGVYQPLAGRFTMLGSLQYLGRNNQTSINQPIYVDFKTGNVYLWADNFAMFNSELFDNKLGTKWQNKWLKIKLDDGTLPKGFNRALIKAHIEALDRNYNDAEVTQFAFIAPNTLSSLSPKLPEQQITPMLQSAQIIQRQRSGESYRQSYINYLSSFYKDITEQYPELIKEDESNEISDSESGSDMFTSKALVQQVLALMQREIANSTSIEEDSASNASKKNILNSTVTDLYGFSPSGQLQWHHNRSDISDSTNVKVSKPMTMDVLQQYLPLRTQGDIFPNLPNEVQVPNESNSVDLREYSKEIKNYYQSGGGTILGKMLYGMMPALRNQSGINVDTIVDEP